MSEAMMQAETRESVGRSMLRGASDTAGAAFAAIPLGLAFGVVLVQSGLDWWWGTVFAGLIFAGSFEFVLMGLVLAAVPLSQIALTAFLVNFRHVFYSLTFPLHRIRGIGKAYATFALTDEAWALTAHPEAQTRRQSRILTMQWVFQLAWVGSVTIGGLAGVVVPDSVVGLDFALTALFIVLTIEAIKAQRDIPTPFVAAGCAIGAWLVVPEAMLPVAMLLFVVYLVVRFLIERRTGRLPAGTLPEALSTVVEGPGAASGPEVCGPESAGGPHAD